LISSRHHRVEFRLKHFLFNIPDRGFSSRLLSETSPFIHVEESPLPRTVGQALDRSTGPSYGNAIRFSIASVIARKTSSG